MGRCLVVANRTLAGEHLIARIRDRIASGVTQIHLLVPATPDPDGWTHDEISARDLARQRLDQALSSIADLGVAVDGEVGDHLPYEAVTDLLRREDFDEIIVSTLPVGVSGWLRMDLVSRLQRATDLSVDHVIANDVDGG